MLVTSDEVVCTIGDSPATVTVSWTFDSFSVKLSTTRWPALNVQVCERISVAKPGDLDLQRVAAFRRQRRDHVAPALVGGGRARQAGGDVLDR